LDLKISSAPELKGTIFVPGDKSISHRALIFAALAEGKTSITNLLTAADCLSTLSCLRRLGVPIERRDSQVLVDGVGLRGLKEPDNFLDAGNSGTAIRILPGVLAGQNFLSILTGDGSLRSRPMGRIIEPLRLMGADIHGRSDNSRAPIAIVGRSLKPISYATPVASAQVKTALLLAALFADGISEITESRQSRDHTERFFEYLSIDFKRESESDGKVKLTLAGQTGYEARDIIVAGDISSAAYFIAAGLLVKGSELFIADVGLNPTRIGMLEVLQNMGAVIEVVEQKLFANEPVGTLLVKSQHLGSAKIGGAVIPRLIDELPVIAVLATQAEGQTIIKDAAELRVKETDRITCLVSELSKMGAKIEAQSDGFIIDGPTQLHGAVVDSHGDHRLAMSLAIAGLVAEGETVIQNAESISISYPQFEETLRRLVS